MLQMIQHPVGGPPREEETPSLLCRVKTHKKTPGIPFHCAGASFPTSPDVRGAPEQAPRGIVSLYELVRLR